MDAGETCVQETARNPGAGMPGWGGGEESLGAGEMRDKGKSERLDLCC